MNASKKRYNFIHMHVTCFSNTQSQLCIWKPTLSCPLFWTAHARRGREKERGRERERETDMRERERERDAVCGIEMYSALEVSTMCVWGRGGRGGGEIERGEGEETMYQHHLF